MSTRPYTLFPHSTLFRSHLFVAWLAAQPGNVPAAVPDLESLGFRLVGQDILPGAGSAPAAQLHYRDDTGQHVTLTMRAGGQAGQTRFTFARDGADSRSVWQDAPKIGRTARRDSGCTDG